MARPPWWRWLLALPWVVAVVLVTAAAVRGGPAAADRAPDRAATSTMRDRPPPADGHDDDRADRDGREEADAASRPTGARLDGASAAAVLAAVRTAVGTHGLDVPPGATRDETRRRWVLDQVIDPPVPDGVGGLTVLVHATVITRTTTGWAGPTLARVQVRVPGDGPPVVLDVGASGETRSTPAGEPSIEPDADRDGDQSHRGHDPDDGPDRRPEDPPDAHDDHRLDDQ